MAGRDRHIAPGFKLIKKAIQVEGKTFYVNPKYSLKKMAIFHGVGYLDLVREPEKDVIYRYGTHEEMTRAEYLQFIEKKYISKEADAILRRHKRKLVLVYGEVQVASEIVGLVDRPEDVVLYEEDSFLFKYYNKLDKEHDVKLRPPGQGVLSYKCILQHIFENKELFDALMAHKYVFHKLYSMSDEKYLRLFAFGTSRRTKDMSPKMRALCEIRKIINYYYVKEHATGADTGDGNEGRVLPIFGGYRRGIWEKKRQ